MPQGGPRVREHPTYWQQQAVFPWRVSDWLAVAEEERMVKWKVNHGVKSLWICFAYTADGKMCRYRRRAKEQNVAAATAEQKQRKALAWQTGCPLFEHEIPKPPEPEKPKLLTMDEFYTGQFTELHIPTLKPSSRVAYGKRYRLYIKPTFGKLILAEIDDDAIARWEAAMLTKGMRPSMPGISTVLRSILERARKHGQIKVLPDVQNYKRAKKDVPTPTLEEAARMFDAAKGWVKVAIGLAVYCGMRSGEVRALAVEDIDFVRQQINIRHGISGDEMTTPKSGDMPDLPAPATGAYW
jgi:hypothetical protein